LRSEENGGLADLIGEVSAGAAAGAGRGTLGACGTGSFLLSLRIFMRYILKTTESSPYQIQTATLHVLNLPNNRFIATIMSLYVAAKSTDIKASLVVV